IMEKKWEYKGTVYQLFIDFKKAYDSVKRQVLYDILIEFGIPKKLVRLIKMCLSETYSRVRIVLEFGATSIGVGSLIGTGYGIYKIITGEKRIGPQGPYPKEILFKDRHRRPKLREEDLNTPSEEEIKVTDYSKYLPRQPEEGQEPGQSSQGGQLAGEETPPPIFIPHSRRNTGHFVVVEGGELKRVYSEELAPEIPEDQGQDAKKGDDEPTFNNVLVIVSRLAALGAVSYAAAPAHYAAAYAIPALHAGVPLDTPEVAAAKTTHFAIVAAPAHYAAAYAIPALHAGVPLDTPEVAAAKTTHFAIVAAPAHYAAAYAIPALHAGVPLDTP
ncbi:hypothetical protein ANN_11118, partial [Periplaneta americana]